MRLRKADRSGVRTLLACLLLIGPAAAEDVVYLRRGGELRGTVTATTERVVVLTMASGEIRLPRGEVARIRRDVADASEAKREIRRDDWYFLLRDSGQQDTPAGVCRAARAARALSLLWDRPPDL